MAEINVESTNAAVFLNVAARKVCRTRSRTLLSPHDGISEDPSNFELSNTGRRFPQHKTFSFTASRTQLSRDEQQLSLEPLWKPSLTRSSSWCRGLVCVGVWNGCPGDEGVSSWGWGAGGTAPSASSDGPCPSGSGPRTPPPPLQREVKGQTRLLLKSREISSRSELHPCTQRPGGLKWRSTDLMTLSRNTPHEMFFA